MISRHIECEPQNDDYRRLANYIADAGHDGEKCLMTWCAGCWAGNNEYQLAIQEVEDTQALNRRTTKEKTYHLIISFRPEDEAKLTPEIFKAIELEFAKELGFGEHQRHCGVHRNTDNIHLHIAFNQIHPETTNRHEPYRDYWIRDRLCRRLEQMYGLAVDNGRDPEADKPINDTAMAFEAQTGQESLFSYAQRHKTVILSALGKAQSWSDSHRIFLEYGLIIKPHGNGLMIQTADGRHSIKASGLDRSISKTKLEKRFGAFTPASPELLQSDSPAKKYTAAPLHKEPDRDKLYEQFKAAMAKRQTALTEVSQQDARLFAIHKQGWEKKRAATKKTPMLRTHRKKVMEELKARESAERAALRKQMKQKREDVRNQYQFNSWSKFLRHQASQGNEIALAILRSKKETASPERIPAVSTQPSAAPPETTLASVAAMRECFRSEGLKTEPQYTLDTKGTIIFKLPDGGTIRDTGTEVHCSVNNDQVKRIATKFAQARWDKGVHILGSVMINQAQHTVQRQQAVKRSDTIER